MPQHVVFKIITFLTKLKKRNKWHFLTVLLIAFTITALVKPPAVGAEDMAVPLSPDVGIEEPVVDGNAIICTDPDALLIEGLIEIGTTFPKLGLGAGPPKPAADITLLVVLGLMMILDTEVCPELGFDVLGWIIFDVP